MRQRSAMVASAALFWALACGDSDDSKNGGGARDGGNDDGSTGPGTGGSGNVGGRSNATGGSLSSGGALATAGKSGGGTGGKAGQGAGGKGSGGKAGQGTGGSAGGAGGAPATSGQGLVVDGNRILAPDGRPFHGRGANLFDTRSCEACTYLPPDVDGLNRWSDELLDGWGANFVRFGLWSFADDGGFRQQWRSVTDDPAYVADIHNTVSHMTAKAGVYVMVTVFIDPTIKPDNGDYDSEWPTAGTNAVYEKLAETFADNPKVLFGLTNEPHGPEDRNAELAQRYVAAIDAIRAVEQGAGSPEHIVVVQAPQGWSRDLSYFVQNPIQRTQVAYEVHVYNPQADFDGLLTEPARTLPILVGEYGPSQYSSDADVRALWDHCQNLEIAHAGWSFHMRCDPSMLADSASDACGLSASTGFTFPRTGWGDMLHDYLATPW